MLLTNKHKKQFAWFYLLCFIVNYGWYFLNNLLLCQVNPVFFINKLDVTRNIVMLTSLQHLLIDSYWLRLVFDMLFLLLPLLLWFLVIKERKGFKTVAVVTSLICLVYGIYVSAFTHLSLELFVAWMLIPLVFYAASAKGFYHLLHCIRIIFILIFFTAGLWKIRAGGIFNMEQMSGILVEQHSEYLVSNSTNWFSQFVYFLVGHPAISYSLYLVGLIAELIFILGLFTRRFDTVLLVAFLFFLIADLFLMQINYFNWLVFAGLLYFSKYKLKEDVV